MALEQYAPSACSKAAEIRVTRAARDVLFAAYESISENPELMATVPAKNRSEVNLLPSPNASIPTGNPHSSPQVGAGHSQTNPERAYGQAHSRGGEANTSTAIDTGLALVGGSVWPVSSMVAKWFV